MQCPAEEAMVFLGSLQNHLGVTSTACRPHTPFAEIIVRVQSSLPLTGSML